jgi:hypothetical protein
MCVTVLSLIFYNSALCIFCVLLIPTLLETQTIVYHLSLKMTRRGTKIVKPNVTFFSTVNI